MKKLLSKLMKKVLAIYKPFIEKLKKTIRSLVAQYLELKSALDKLQKTLWREQARVETLTDSMMTEKAANIQLNEIAHDFDSIKKAIGSEKTNSILHHVWKKEWDYVDNCHIHAQEGELDSR